MGDQIFVTGFGCISAIGNNTDEMLQNLLKQRHGISNIELVETIHAGVIPAGEIKLNDKALCKLAGVPEKSGYSRTALIAIIAVREALKMAGISNLQEARTGLISSTTVGGMREFEVQIDDLLDLSKPSAFMPYAQVSDTGEHTERIADQFGFSEYISTVSTACSSASNAIIFGAELIRHGKLDRVVCGGSDVLSKFTINGFNSLMILDKAFSRPFDASRAGVNLGEGAGYLILESEAEVQRTGKTVYAILSGYSNSNDAYHQTASSPDGDGALLSMQRAMNMAGLSRENIDYINCHGTATENNDLSEALAISNLFGDHVPHFSSTKPYTGHTLAAAGGVEAIISILGLQQRVIFPNLNYANPMPETNIKPVTQLLENVELNHILSNSFGFGGSNTSLIFSKPR
ncbi:MAG: beta-ketoacyl-[acyl-carrier-protein] synthase family protein [Chitinophagales bacterium]